MEDYTPMTTPLELRRSYEFANEKEMLARMGITEEEFHFLIEKNNEQQMKHNTTSHSHRNFYESDGSFFRKKS